ncbi:MAG TPA: hypothetical protein VMG10_15055 [Gemmataceae bacterium]|nr:hypothetical protein [Gemmataceae bacterium]
MQTRDIVGLTLIPIALLIAAGTLSVAGVGSIVWFCALLASGVLIIALLSFCYGFSPSRIPLRSFSLVYIGSVAVVGLGVLLRICFHEELRHERLFDMPVGSRQPRETNWAFVILRGIYEWLSFSGILFCIFFAVRVVGPGGTDIRLPNQPPSQQ